MFNNIKKRKIVVINKYDNVTKIKISKKLDYQKLLKEIEKNDLIDETIRKSIISTILKYTLYDTNVNEKNSLLEIYIIKGNDKTYELIKENDNNFLITQKTIINQKPEEVMIELKNNNYKIMHNLKDSINDIKTYSKDNNNNNYSNKLNKEDAFTYAKKMLDDMCMTKEIKNIIDINLLYKKLNIITKDKYNPVISDDKISLCTIKKEDNINNKKRENFLIVLNDTFEVVGDISYNYLNEGPSELGNVIYNVKKEYRHNGYCTKALNLLKELLKNNTYNGDKSLYLATINEYSIKVAKKNGGVLYNEEYKDSESKDLENDLSDENDNEVELFKIGI